METTIKRLLVFSHGWANTPHFFSPLVAQMNTHFPDFMRESRVVLLNQRYFEEGDRGFVVIDGILSGTKDTTAPGSASHDQKTTGLEPLSQLQALRSKYKDASWHGIGHSLGFAQLLQLPVQWKTLVSLHGFTRFCASKESPEGTPVRVLDRMAQQFERNWQQVLAAFWERSAGSAPRQPQGH